MESGNNDDHLFKYVYLMSRLLFLVPIVAFIKVTRMLFQVYTNWIGESLARIDMTGSQEMIG